MVYRLLLGVIAVVLFLVGCTSPGKPFTVKDLRISAGPSANPTQPLTTQTVTLNYTIRNTWNEAMNNIAWEIRKNTDPMDPLSGSVVDSGTTTIAAFGSIALSTDLGMLAKGKYTYALIIDPSNTIAEEVETNNTGQVTVLVADQDISFGTPAPTITGPGGLPPTNGDDLTIKFTILHTLSSATPTPPSVAISVPFKIMLNGMEVTPSASTPTSPANVDPAGTNPLPVEVVVPAPGIGSFPYTIVLEPADGDDSNTSNNSVEIVVAVPAPG